MSCPNCGHENRADANFCAQCGDSLQITCPVCSFVNPPDANFCSNCGNRLTSGTTPTPGQDVTSYVPPEMLSKINAARATNPMRGERRTVTMLFADIQGSTAAAESLDPEDWTDIINGAFEHLIGPVYRYEGTLARLLGDAVLAFFGAPIAHEDDPVRAVRAGLEIVAAMEDFKDEIAQSWGIPIDVRVGINTGLVVVGEVGSDLRVEYTALGDAVNVAARMEQTADPGTVRVTRETWDLVAEHFEGEEIGPVDVKGKSEPVPAVRVLGHGHGDIHAAVARPLIGRIHEVERLDALRGRLVDGTGWVASIIGEAGLGKSRLLDEFREITAAAVGTATGFGQGGELSWMSALNESYDASVPYSSIAQLLGRWWGLEEAEDPFRRLEQAVGAVVPDLSDAAAYLGYVASLPLPEATSDFLERLDPPVLDARVRQTLVAYLEGEARRRPLVVSLEDVHWADPLSLALIEDVMELTETVPLGMVFTMRPYRDEPPWRIHEVAERDHRHRYESVDLVSLGRETAEHLLDSLLDGVAVPADLRSRILGRSDGNPLFLEQMAYAIREEEADMETVPVPTGLSSLLTARLDRLEAESKMVAQIASVIGSEFHRSTLAALMGEQMDLDRRLTDLLRREILVERRDQAGTLAFHHALMQEAAYSTMLLRTRRELHARLAEHLAATAPESVQEIAIHFQEAGDTQRAFPYLVEAGERSSRSMALSDAIHFFTAALENMPAGADPDLIVRGHDGLGVAYTLVPDLTQSEATYQRLVDYADSSGRPSAKVTALNRLAMTTAMLGGDLDSARGYLDRAYELANEAGDEFGLAQYHMNACTIAGLRGDLETSLVHDTELSRWGGELGVEALRAEGLTRLAENSVWLMEFDRAESAVEEAIEATREAGDEHNLALLHGLVLSQLRMRDGDMAGALQLTLDAEDTLARYASFFLPLARGLAGRLLYEQGRIEEALAHFQDARTEAAAAQQTFFVAVSWAGLARIHGSLGMGEQMEEARSAALEAVHAPLGNYVASTVWAELALGSLDGGDLETARRDLEAGLASSSASQYWEKPRLLIGRALLLAETGDASGAHGSLDEAQTFLLEKGMRTYDAHLDHARAEAFLAEGKPEEAAPRLTRALELASAAEWRVLALRIAGTAARVATLLGDDEAARRHVAAARADVEEMAGRVTDPDLRRAMERAWSRPLDQIPAG